VLHQDILEGRVDLWCHAGCITTNKYLQFTYNVLYKFIYLLTYLCAATS